MTDGQSNKFDLGLDRAIRGAFYVMACSLTFSISLAQIALALLIVLTAGRAIRRRRLELAIGPAGVVLLIFLGWVLLTWPLSLNPGDAFRRLPKYWAWFVFFVSLAALDSRQTARRALWAMVIGAGVTAIYGIAQHFFCEAVPRILAPPVQLRQPNGNYCHAVGFFDHHLTYGNSLAIVLLLGIGLWLAETGRRERAVLGAALGLGSLALLWSYGRSAWLGMLAGLLTFGAQLGRRVLAAVVLGAFALGSLAYVASPSLAHRMRQAVRSEDNLERLYIWKTSLAMIADHPLFGIGPGAYRRMTTEYRAGYNIHWTAWGHAHNSYLSYAAESGIPAGLLFTLFLATLIALGAKPPDGIKEDDAARRLRAGATAAAVGFAAASLLQHNGGDTVVVMTFQIAAALIIFWTAPPAGEEAER
jgi:putative inorganic carbon (HCO3(-)) transporter